MSVEQLMEEIKSALPERTKEGRETVREVCLTLFQSGTWQALAGGSYSVHIGESGGDFFGEAATAEAALVNLLEAIRG